MDHGSVHLSRPLRIFLRCTQPSKHEVCVAHSVKGCVLAILNLNFIVVGKSGEARKRGSLLVDQEIMEWSLLPFMELFWEVERA